MGYHLLQTLFMDTEALTMLIPADGISVLYEQVLATLVKQG